MPLDNDSRFPPLPEIYTEKLRGIDPEGTAAKQQEFEDWFRKFCAALQQGN